MLIVSLIAARFLQGHVLPGALMPHGRSRCRPTSMILLLYTAFELCGSGVAFFFLLIVFMIAVVWLTFGAFAPKKGAGSGAGPGELGTSIWLAIRKTK